MDNLRIISNQFLRGFEKIPGINLLQVAQINNKNILMFPKVGTRTIRDTILKTNKLKMNNQAWRHIRYVSRNNFRTKYNNENTFIPLRHPLDRLFSCWKQKISSQRDNGIFYFFNYYPLLKKDMSFIDFLRAIKRIHIKYHEKHFIPLGHFIGELEEMNYSFFSISDLNKTLSGFSGSEIKKKSNTTKSRTISRKEKEYYFLNLSNFYKLDEDLHATYAKKL